MTMLVSMFVAAWQIPMVVQQTQTPVDLKINADSFTSAEVCGECHQAIHAVWQRSLHSRAFSNGIFQAAYREMLRDGVEEKSQLCLRCHAPTVRQTKDFKIEDPITEEGVTCDFCHSVRDVKIERAGVEADLDVGRTKYGPLKHAQSPAHTIVNSKLHRSSELCATCHEYRNKYGVPILETYSEWKAGPYPAQGKQCQDCHMPLVPGRVVALGVKGTSHDQVNLHDISGSHDIERVREAVTMKILSAIWIDDGDVRVRIRVKNVGGGHRFPTGVPMHRGVLEVKLMDRDRRVDQRTVTFEKVLMNAKGMPIAGEAEAFTEARSIRNDTRIKPREARVVNLTFRKVKMTRGRIEASLGYAYSTRVLTVEEGVETIKPMEMKFLLRSDKKELPRRRGRASKATRP